MASIKAPSRESRRGRQLAVPGFDAGESKIGVVGAPIGILVRPGACRRGEISDSVVFRSAKERPFAERKATLKTIDSVVFRSGKERPFAERKATLETIDGVRRQPVEGR